jgi:hypothetical protein
MFGMTSLPTSFLSGGMEIIIHAVKPQNKTGLELCWAAFFVHVV